MKKSGAYRLLTFLAAALLAASCSSSVRFAEKAGSGYDKSVREYSGTPKGRTDGNAPEIIKEAEKWVGTPYCFGGNSHDCTDCSGFVMEIYKGFGINLPRTAAEQFEFTSHIGSGDSRPGDLVFFRTKGKISHVGIYAGNNEIIHSSAQKGVIRQSLDDPYLQKIYAGCGRVGGK